MLKGIDVSYHQGKIDWKKVKNDGIRFAIIRAGYGKNTIDKRFIENIKGALGVGLDVGVYWFIYAKDVAESVENAMMCHKAIGAYKDNIRLKVWADWEYDSDKRNPQTKESRTQIVKAFCDRLAELGYEVGVYSNIDYLKNKFGDLSEYPLWLAYYNSLPNYICMLHQYTSKGKVNGINGNVDMDYLYEYEERKDEYYNVPQLTLVEALKKIGVNSSYRYRKQIAQRNGISDYSGTAEQNIHMLNLLMEGKLKKV